MLPRQGRFALSVLVELKSLSGMTQEVNLHYSGDQTYYPAHFQSWDPVGIDAFEAGLKMAGVPMRENLSLKDSDSKQWGQYLLDLWKRHQNKPALQQPYLSNVLRRTRGLRRGGG